MNSPNQLNVFLIICTFKRIELLLSLLDDIANQSLIPENVVIVDGDKQNNELPKILSTRKNALFNKIYYLKSNHSNLSYQRYLGWKFASQKKTDCLLYFDDDLRLLKNNIIEEIVRQLINYEDVVGITTTIRMGKFGNKHESYKKIINRKPQSSFLRNGITKFGSSSKIKPGGLTPSGDRILPRSGENHSFSEVEWLRGGVMAYKMSAITSDCFLEDLFALDEKRFGKGEDTILSRRVMQKGKLIYLHDVIVDHPNVDLPKTYPITAYKLAYATSYSRRFLNDHYRVTIPPKMIDRISLIKSYIGNSFINWGQAFLTLKKHKFSYALGYSMGSLRGIFQKPTAKNLTPHINWWQDAEEALKNQIIIQ